MTKRGGFGLGFLAVVVILGFSLYLQFFVGLNPCPLCTLQRIDFVSIGILFFFGAIFAGYKIIRRLIYMLLLSFASLGLYLAGRQIYIQHYPPPDTGECSASLHYLLQIMPANEVWHRVIRGSVDCSEAGWTFIKLNIAEWSFLWFGIFFVMTLFLIRAEMKN